MKINERTVRIGGRNYKVFGSEFVLPQENHIYTISFENGVRVWKEELETWNGYYVANGNLEYHHDDEDGVPCVYYYDDFCHNWRFAYVDRVEQERRENWL